MADENYIKVRQIRKIFARICSEHLDVEVIWTEDSSFEGGREHRAEGKIRCFDLKEFDEYPYIKLCLKFESGDRLDIMLSYDYYFDGHHDNYIKMERCNGDGTYNELMINYK